MHYGAYGFAFSVEVAGDLFGFGEEEFVAFVVEEEDFLFPDLIDVGYDDGSDEFAVFGGEVVFLQLHDFGGEGLPEVEYGAPTEVGEMDFVGDFLSDGAVGIDFLRIAECDLEVGVGDVSVFDDGAVAPYLEVALFGVDDHVVVFVGAEHFGDDVTEGFFEDVDHRLLVDILQVFEFLKGVFHFPNQYSYKIQILKGKKYCIRNDNKKEYQDRKSNVCYHRKIGRASCRERV